MFTKLKIRFQKMFSHRVIISLRVIFSLISIKTRIRSLPPTSPDLILGWLDRNAAPGRETTRPRALRY